jgi:hypothetical protein
MYTTGASYVPGTASAMLPPGQYIYSPYLPQVMQSITPAYNILFEPILFDHFMQHMGKKLHLLTVGGPLEGILTGVAVDHVQLTIQGVGHHIRNQHIIFFKEA